PLVGLLIGRHIHDSFEAIAGIVGPMMLFLCGFLVFHMARKSQSQAQKVGQLANSRWTLLLLPFSLSLDNLFAGVGLGAMGYPILLSALIVGSVSSSLALGGMFIGSWLRRRLARWNTNAISGVYLMVMSAILLLVDFD
ncbi:MAG: manganese efflux pump, partial [Spirulina sp.]